MRVLYFGCHERAGHYIWKPGMRSSESRLEMPFDAPWDEVDMTLAPRRVGLDRYSPWKEVETDVDGEAWLHHKGGWTALAFWDKSIDRRPCSNSVFFAEGTHSFEEMVALAQAHFPEVWSRLPFEVRLAEEAVPA